MKAIFVKHSFSIVLLLFMGSNINAQVIEFANTTQKFERSKTIDQTFYLSEKVNKTLAGALGPIALAIAANPNPADYSLPHTSFNVAALAANVNIPFIVLHGDASDKGDIVVIIFTDPVSGSPSQVSITIVPGEEKKHGDNNQIMFLNAYNFDFGSTALSSNYVGHLNFFVPSCSKSGKWGFNTGIMKINYSQRDTNNNVQHFENVTINPFDILQPGSKYLKQVNAYKTEQKNTVGSFYVQPLREITHGYDKVHIYEHLHFELLASKWTTTTNISTIKQDTGIYQPSPSFVSRNGLQNSYSYSVNTLSGYFGGGLTFDVKPWDGGSFFFQPTVGFTTNKPSPSSIAITDNRIVSSYGKGEPQHHWNEFYLVRAYYKHVIADQKAVAVVGIDIRGLLPYYSPQYAVYVGLNLSLKSIFSLISDK